MNKDKLIALIPWGLNKIYIFSIYLLAGYMLLGTAYSLISDLSVYTMNILFGLGLIPFVILAIPAIMSTDSGPSTSGTMVATAVASYPIIYIISLIASRWIPGVPVKSDLAIMLAAMPLINVIFLFAILIRLIIKK